MRDDAVVLWCTLCATGYASVGEIPPTCPGCGKACRWTTTAPQGDIPKIPYTLTANDRAFLHRRGIKES